MTYISIIIPTFNKSPLVCDVVQRLTQQTFKDFEVIVVDDGSSDDTVRRLKVLRRKERHLKIKVLCTGLKDMFGMCRAINMGLVEASGPVSFLLNDDIYLHPLCLEKHMLAHKQLPQCAFVGPRFYCPPHVLGQSVSDTEVYRQYTRKYTTQKIFKGLPVYRQKMMVSSNFSINTQKLCDIGGYNEFFKRYTGAIDKELYHRLSLNRTRVLFLFQAQAHAIRYDNATYRQTQWVSDKNLHGGVSIEEWKREQMRYSIRLEMKAREQPPPPIKRRRPCESLV